MTGPETIGPEKIGLKMTAPNTLRFAGYAALFGMPDGARDTISPGAFRRSLAELQDPLPLYWQHSAEQRIGWIESIAEDERGLRVVARIDNPDGRAATELKKRSVDGLSFGYRARSYRRNAGGRQLDEVELFEISLVTHPLQHGARVHMIR